MLPHLPSAFPSSALRFRLHRWNFVHHFDSSPLRRATTRRSQCSGGKKRGVPGPERQRCALCRVALPRRLRRGSLLRPGPAHARAPCPRRQAPAILGLSERRFTPCVRANRWGRTLVDGATRVRMRGATPWPRWKPSASASGAAKSARFVALHRCRATPPRGHAGGAGTAIPLLGVTVPQGFAGSARALPQAAGRQRSVGRPLPEDCGPRVRRACRLPRCIVHGPTSGGAVPPGGGRCSGVGEPSRVSTPSRRAQGRSRAAGSLR